MPVRPQVAGLVGRPVGADGTRQGAASGSATPATATPAVAGESATARGQAVATPWAAATPWTATQPGQASWADEVPADPTVVRPVTTRLLAAARVAPPPAIPVRRSTALAAPGMQQTADSHHPPVPPASAVGSDPVIRRSLAGATPAGAAPAGAIPPAGAAPAGTPATANHPHGTAAAPGAASRLSGLLGSVPPEAFARARAELAADGVIRRWATPGTEATTPTTIDAAPGSAPAPRSVESSLSSREWDELVAEVTRRIEGRIVDELARRGRRSLPRTL
jgi:hypothetical protein